MHTIIIKYYLNFFMIYKISYLFHKMIYNIKIFLIFYIRYYNTLFHNINEKFIVIKVTFYVSEVPKQ